MIKHNSIVWFAMSSSLCQRVRSGKRRRGWAMAQGSHFYLKKINRILISTLRISILSSDHKKIIKDHKLTPPIANRAFVCDRKFCIECPENFVIFFNLLQL